MSPIQFKGAFRGNKIDWIDTERYDRPDDEEDPTIPMLVNLPGINFLEGRTG
jgi:hypothetical protein